MRPQLYVPVLYTQPLTESCAAPLFVSFLFSLLWFLDRVLRGSSFCPFFLFSFFWFLDLWSSEYFSALCEYVRSDPFVRIYWSDRLRDFENNTSADYVTAIADMNPNVADGPSLHTDVLTII